MISMELSKDDFVVYRLEDDEFGLPIYLCGSQIDIDTLKRKLNVE